jgi:hypothetical protein
MQGKHVNKHTSERVKLIKKNLVLADCAGLYESKLKLCE